MTIRPAAKMIVVLIAPLVNKITLNVNKITIIIRSRESND